MALAELIAAPYLREHAAPVRVGVLDDGGDLRDTCRDDDFVGACAAIVSTARHEDALRFHFVSEGGRNDWTAVTTVSGELRKVPRVRLVVDTLDAALRDALR